MRSVFLSVLLIVDDVERLISGVFVAAAFNSMLDGRPCPCQE
jgi:hypothetical protein